MHVYAKIAGWFSCASSGRSKSALSTTRWTNRNRIALRIWIALNDKHGFVEHPFLFRRLLLCLDHCPQYRENHFSVQTVLNARDLVHQPNISLNNKTKILGMVGYCVTPSTRRTCRSANLIGSANAKYNGFWIRGMFGFLELSFAKLSY